LKIIAVRAFTRDPLVLVCVYNRTVGGIYERKGNRWIYSDSTVLAEVLLLLTRLISWDHILHSYVNTKLRVKSISALYEFESPSSNPEKDTNLAKLKSSSINSPS